jgi:peptidylprolyl isomerase
MASHRRPTLLVPSLLAALLAGPIAGAQPIEPLGSSRPEPPPAPADAAEPPASATKTESGLVWKMLSKPQTGEHPRVHDRVRINFTGWTPGGEVIDSSIPDGEPRMYPMDELIKGLSEGLQLMAKGERRRFWIPAALAESGRPKRRGPAAPSVFDVTLVDFVKMPDPMPVPDDVAAAPDDAKRTKSGIAYKFIKHGKGRVHPTADSTVEVHYTGWTPNGEVFDSSLRRGQPISFPLSGVIKGWTEGVQLMVVGDRVRFWIPSALAYGDKPSQPGSPAGPLVFEIDLLSIK